MEALFAAALQAVSGVVGHILSKADKEQATQLIQQAIDENGNLDVPKLENMVAEQVGPSAMEAIKTDPEYLAAQRSALTRLGERADAGYTIEDKAAQMEALRQSGRQEQAGRQRIAADAAARGQLGGGTTLAMMLQNQQGAAERGADIGMQTAANSQRRMYEAMRDRASLAGQMRGQDWQEKAQQAQAADMVARYNADARRSAQGQNLANQQWTYGARRQQGQDRLRNAQMKAGILSDRGDQTAQMVAGTGAGVAQGIGAYGQYRQQQEADDKNWDRYGPNRQGVADGKSGGWY